MVAAFSKKLGLIAVKSRRLDSKRSTLALEARRLSEASLAGVAPRVHYYDDDLIVMDIVWGPALEEMIEAYGVNKRIVAEVLELARTLDAIGVLHHELSRPWRNVLFTCETPLCKALVVDLESSGAGCGNVPLVLGGLATRSARLRALLMSIRRQLGEYAEHGCSREEFIEIKSRVLEALEDQL
ncbi:MAG: hypothetical protein QXK97_03050 [Acidilobaceae archaeon]